MIQQLQGIPFARIMGGGQYDASSRSDTRYLHFEGWGRGQSQIKHIHSAGHEGTANQMIHHIARHAGIPAYHDQATLTLFLQHNCVGVDKGNDIGRGKVAAGVPPNGSADS
jgi:hypothetical protein